MKSLKIFGFLLVAAINVSSANELDQLLRQVQQDGLTEAAVHAQREQQFLANKTTQQERLNETKTALKNAKKLNQQLEAQLAANAENINALKQELSKEAGNLNEVFGVVRQVSADLSEQLSQSIISAQFPERFSMIAEIQDKKTLPNVAELKTLWYLLQHEMTESGKVVQFEGLVNGSDGLNAPATVTRIGAFTLFSGAQFLDYSPNTKRLITLARQPDSRTTSIAATFASKVNQSTLALAAIDPTQGSILSMYIEKPTLIERVKQGGIVGYTILCFGLIGLLIAIWRVAVLSFIQTKVTKQQRTPESASPHNPLGRILSVYQENYEEDTEALEIKLEEAILKEAPKLNKGVGAIKLLAAVAPLMGLLGTVVGMIATFQAITLFGTGDPKLMAGGISQALVTTVLGLVVAIPLLFCHSLVQARSKNLVLILTQKSAGLMAQKIEARQSR